MSLKVSNDHQGGDFKLLPPGTHAAVCIAVVDLGPQRSEYLGQVKEQNRVRLRFEVPAERVTWTDKDGVEHEGPMTIWKEYTASLYEKATLCKDLVGWRGRAFTPAEEAGFDLKNVLGVPCLITVVHKTSQAGKEYAKIESISGLMKGMEKPTAENDLLHFDFDAHTEAELEALPQWLQEKIAAGKKLLAEQRERARAGNGAATDAGVPPGPGYGDPENPEFADDDIPF